MTDAELARRVERLERDNRRLKRGGIALVGLLAALTTVYATRPAPQKITAREFDLVDSAGRVRIGMWVAPSGEPSIAPVDAQGKPRVGMAVFSSGEPRIDLVDAQGKGGASMRVAPSGEPSIFLSDAQGNPRAGMWVGPSGEPVIDLNDSQGFTMDLGNTSTTDRTGETQQTAADSIVMFGNDKKHRVIWQAP